MTFSPSLVLSCSMMPWWTVPSALCIRDDTAHDQQREWSSRAGYSISVPSYMHRGRLTTPHAPGTNRDNTLRALSSLPSTPPLTAFAHPVAPGERRVSPRRPPQASERADMSGTVESTSIGHLKKFTVQAAQAFVSAGPRGRGICSIERGVVIDQPEGHHRRMLCLPSRRWISMMFSRRLRNAYFACSSQLTLNASVCVASSLHSSVRSCRPGRTLGPLSDQLLSADSSRLQRCSFVSPRASAREYTCVGSGSWATRRDATHPPSREATVLCQNRHVSHAPVQMPPPPTRSPLPQFQKSPPESESIRTTAHKQQGSRTRMAAGATRRHDI